MWCWSAAAQSSEARAPEGGKQRGIGLSISYLPAVHGDGESQAGSASSARAAAPAELKVSTPTPTLFISLELAAPGEEGELIDSWVSHGRAGGEQAQ